MSAIIATRGRPTLGRAIEGILGQRYGGVVTCIVVFDGVEPERSLGHQDRRATARWWRSRTGRTPGLAGARNTGADAAETDLLAFCDDDDVWWPEKLRAQVELCTTRARAVGHGCPDRRRRAGDRPHPPAGGDPRRVGALAGRRGPSFLGRGRARRLPTTAIGPIDEAIPGSYGEDYEWLLRAAGTHPIAGVPQALVTVHWGGSLFADRWPTIIEAITYLTSKHPDLLDDDANAARLLGRLAFAHAALRHRREASRWAWRSIRRRAREPRPYLALAVASGCVRASTIQRRANRAGRGV